MWSIFLGFARGDNERCLHSKVVGIGTGVSRNRVGENNLGITARQSKGIGVVRDTTGLTEKNVVKALALEHAHDCAPRGFRAAIRVQRGVGCHAVFFYTIERSDYFRWRRNVGVGNCPRVAQPSMITDDIHGKAARDTIEIPSLEVVEQHDHPDKADSYGYDIAPKFGSLPSDLCKLPGIGYTVGSVILRAVIAAFGVKLAVHHKCPGIRKACMDSRGYQIFALAQGWDGIW